MSTNRSFLKTLLILTTAGLLAGRGATLANMPSDPQQGAARQEAVRLGGNPSATDNAMTGSGTLHRATKSIGEPLKNTQGATLGKIHDLVLTPDLEQVSYAVISRGGVLGMGKRFYAIPWSAMRAGVGDAIVAPIDVRELDQDPGFDTKQWPSQGDPRWLSRAGERTEQVTFDVQPAAEQKEIRRRRVSHILGMTARGMDNDRVGTVKDILISMDTGAIPFTIVSYGGLMGLGDKYTAVPANAIKFEPADKVARVQVDEQILQANAFNPGDFPDLSDPIYSQRLYAAYNVAPADADWTVLGYVPPEGPARTQPQATFPARTQPAQPQTPPGLQVPQTPAPSPIQNDYLAVFKPENLRTIEGVVTGVSSFQLVGTNAEWVQLQIRTDDGNLATVHLGPRDYVSRQDFYVASNDRIVVTGAQATAWRQPIILPITASVSGRTISLRDQTGRPLWDQMTEPQRDLSQPQTQPQTRPQSQVQTQAQPQAQPQTQPQTEPQAQPQQNQSQPIP